MQDKYKSGYETNLADKSSLTAQTLTDSSFTGGIQSIPEKIKNVVLVTVLVLKCITSFTLILHQQLCSVDQLKLQFYKTTNLIPSLKGGPLSLGCEGEHLQMPRLCDCAEALALACVKHSVEQSKLE